MAALPSKRRKLDHDRREDGFISEDESGNTSPDDQPSSSSADEAPVALSKQTQTRPKQTRDADDIALYAGSLYKSSLFKLQIDELLAEVQPNYEKRLNGVDDALRRLKSLIEAIDERAGLSILEAAKSLHKSHKITIPFPDPKPDKNAAYKLAYAKPSTVNVVGSYVLKTMVKSDNALAVDMVVVMPISIFQDKDYLNYRYFYKRAYYLACVAAGLQDVVRDEFMLSFDYLNENDLHPILTLKPISGVEGKTSTGYEIRIIPTAPSDFFTESKLRPDKNSIRPKEGTQSKTAAPSPTPFYNASLRADCNFESYLKVLHSASKRSTAFQEACILGRTWLRQRGFGSALSKGGFGNFEWAAVSVLLLNGGGSKGSNVLSPSYSSYQMFKAIIQYLATTDLTNKPLVSEATTDFNVQKSNLPLVYDGSRGQSLLYKMTPWSYALLREEAKVSLDMLNDDTFDQFEPTFIVRSAQPLQRYDCLFQLSIPTEPLSTTACDHATQTTKFSRQVFEVLQEGLMDRVNSIDIQVPAPSSWPVKSTGPPPINQRVRVSVVFDPANIDRLVDHGPPAEEKNRAAKFQKFWGEKAELRRFKDGSILESLVWAPGSTYSVFQQIITYLTKRHFGLEINVDSLRFIGEGFEKLLLSSGAATRNFDALRQAYHVFEQDIRDLRTLPLQLRQLSAVCPQLRYSSIDAPLFNPNHPLKIPADVLIQFEGSGRWPDDVVAIQRTKIALLLKIGSLLRQSDVSIKTRVGLENEHSPLRNCAFLDVIYESGAAFRLRIHNDREQTLLERQVKDKSTDHRIREDAVSTLSTFKRSFIHLPLLTQTIATQCTRFPLLSPTIRLMKMWFDRHMLLGHVSEELVELLVARTFLQPYPWSAPSSTMTGFLRTLLFISRWDWRLVPLIVDFTGTMTSKEVNSINTRLEAWRKIDPGMNRTVLFAASNYDTTGTVFTDGSPSKMVAARMTALARSACSLVKEKGLDLDHRSLFAGSTADYDFVIHISPKFTGEPRRKEATEQKFKNLEVQSEANLDLVGYRPARSFFDELERLFTNSVVFFHGEVDGSVIAGLWNPQTVASRSFKVNLAYATKPSGKGEEDTAQIEIDKPAILAEIARLGGDIVSRIEVHG